MRGRRIGVAVAALAAALPVAADGHGGHHDPPLAGKINGGLFAQGLIHGGSGLTAPLGDRTAAAAEPSPPGESPLRVYVVVVDGLQPTQIGPQTPNLNELKNQGTSYEQARAVLPAETVPNHAAMATGVAPQKNGIIANQFWRGHIAREYMQWPEFWDADTITTRLERAYKGDVDTATILSKEYLYGLFQGEYAGAGDATAQREADFHWDPRLQAAYVPYPSSHSLDQGTMDALLGWIRAEQASSRPQFAFVNLGDVDRAGHADEEGVATAAADRARTGEDELSKDHATPFQQLAITDTDTQIGRLVTELKETGAWDESVLLVLSDHGMDWGPQNQTAATTTSLNAAGFVLSVEGGQRGDYHPVGGGGSELIYVHHDRLIGPMARVLCGADGVSVLATREPVAGLDTSKCRGRTLGELGLDHPYSPEIQVFLEPGWHSDCSTCSTNPLPGNHGHAVTQHSTLMVAGGHPALNPAGSIPGPRVYERGDVAAPAGPGVLSVAPTVAGLFGIGSPAGGYDVPPLTEAFDPGAVDLTTTEPVTTPPAGGVEDGAPEAGPAQAPLVTIGVDVTDADLSGATYTVSAFNRGNATAEDVVVTSTVPFNLRYASSSRPPTDASTCPSGAPGNTTCRWVLGDLAAGDAASVDVSYEFPDTDGVSDINYVASVQTGGLPPSSTDPNDYDGTLTFSSQVVKDVYVDDAAPAGDNRGGCARLEVGSANAVTSFLDPDVAFPYENGATAQWRVDKLWVAELQATVDSVSSAAGAPVELRAHRVVSNDWAEGGGLCHGGAQGSGREARTGAEPESAPTHAASAEASDAGQRLHWDLAGALDTRDRRNTFTGVELRLPEGSSESVILHSSEASDPATHPRFVSVSIDLEEGRCIAAGPETSTRASDATHRVRAYVTEGLNPSRVSAGGQDGCNGMPAPGTPVGWELDDDSPDAYIASLAGEPTEYYAGSQGDAGPNRGSTLTGPNGRTFADIRLAAPFSEGQNTGTTRLAAIALLEHSGYYEPYRHADQAACEPPTTPDPLFGCNGSGESPLEDDVLTTWGPAP